jgi:hypothetical protein
VPRRTPSHRSSRRRPAGLAAASMRLRRRFARSNTPMEEVPGARSRAPLYRADYLRDCSFPRERSCSSPGNLPLGVDPRPRGPWRIRAISVEVARGPGDAAPGAGIGPVAAYRLVPSGRCHASRARGPAGSAWSRRAGFLTLRGRATADLRGGPAVSWAPRGGGGAPSTRLW